MQIGDYVVAEKTEENEWETVRRTVRGYVGWVESRNPDSYDVYSRPNKEGRVVLTGYRAERDGWSVRVESLP